MVNQWPQNHSTPPEKERGKVAPIMRAVRVAQLYTLGRFPGKPVECVRCGSRAWCFARHTQTCGGLTSQEKERLSPLQKLATHQFRTLAGKETIPALLIEAAATIGARHMR